VQAHFIGSLNPRLESAHYLQSIATLLEHYRYELQYPLDRSTEESGNRITEVVPLIVNTQGWVKGLGADLLDQIEALVEATHTFTFNSVGLEIVDGEESRMFMGEDYDMPSERTLSMGYGNVIPLESAPASGLFSRFSPADSRTLSTIAYLHARLEGDKDPEWDFSDALVGKLPWEVDTEDVIKEVYLSGEGSDGILAEDLGLALNGSMVAFVERVSESIDPVERYSPGRVLPLPVETNCVGLGLIRAASTDHPVMQLLTPIAPSLLGRISIIVKGDLELPLCGSLDWKTGSVNDDGLLGVNWDEVPFLSVKPERGVGMGRRKFRRNLMRKNQSN
jgi:polynucleotide 5'-hydroxyl-kinase GRC3/NOL9